MLLSNLVVAASFLTVTFNAITAIPHIRERHIIRVPIKFKTIHHHKIQKIPIIIRKHIHYNKDKHPEVQHVHFNHLPQEDEHLGDHFDIHNEELKNSGISYDHEGGHGTHEYEYEEGEQSEEEEYDDDHDDGDDDDEYE